MNWRTTAALAIILVLIGGYIWYDSQQAAPEDGVDTAVVETVAPPPPTPVRADLIPGQPDNATAINLIDLFTSDEVLFIKQESGEWQQTVPTETLAISPTLNISLSGFVGLRSTRTLPAEENPLSAYGLETPTHQISVSVQSPEDGMTRQYILQIGNLTPTGSGYYTRRQGDERIHIVPQGPIDQMIGLLTNPPLQNDPVEAPAPEGG